MTMLADWILLAPIGSRSTTESRMTPPSEIFQKRLLSPWQAFLSSPGDEGLALSAAQAVNNQLEWVFAYYKNRGEFDRLFQARKLDEFRNQVARRCPNIEIVWYIADGAKHRFLRDPRHKHYATSTDTFVSGDGPLRLDADGRMFVEVLRTVVEFWHNWPD